MIPKKTFQQNFRETNFAFFAIFGEEMCLEYDEND